MLKNRIDKYHHLVGDFLATTSGFGVVLLDQGLQIIDCNPGFMDLFLPREKPVGTPLADFLDLPGPVPSEKQTLKLSCSRKTGQQGVFSCQFLGVEEGFLLFCERLLLTESRVLEQMGMLNNELINLQRELVKKKSLLKQTKAELEDCLSQRSSELKQLSAEQQLLLMTMPSGVCFLQKNRVRQVNPAFEKILGYSSGETLGMDVKAFYPTLGDFQRINHQALDAFAAGEEFTAELELRRKDGSLVWTNISGQAISPTYLEQGAIWVLQDISPRKKAEKEFASIESQLYQAQKMESIGRLAGGVAHDFNNLLTVILGHATFVLKKMDSTHEFEISLQTIQQAAEKGANLTRQLLSFARKQVVLPKVLDMNTVITEMHGLLQRMIGAETRLTFTPTEGLWLIKIDPTQVDQILANLCVNASDAIMGVGDVVITVENLMSDQVTTSSQEYVCLKVRDSGCGIDAETQQMIFEPFYTTKEVGKGTGLGLSTVYGIVQQNDGFIGLESSPGKGSVFAIYLPRYTGRKTSQQRPDEAKRLKEQETILLVDDESNVLLTTAMLLERLGYRVFQAAGAKAAIDFSRQYNGDIDLILTDIVMPEMDGLSLSRRLEERFPGIKRLFVSGYSTEKVSHQAGIHGELDFLQKPFSLEELAQKVRAVLDGQAQH